MERLCFASRLLALAGLLVLETADFAHSCIVGVTICAHDFNGDGKSDILWRHTGGATAIWLMDGALVLQPGNFRPPDIA